MALYTFPSNPLNGDKYPLNPLPGQNQYEWSATDNTWRLLGAATTVIPGCYGDAYTVPSFCVNAQGQIESVLNTTILTSGGTVTDVTAGIGLLGGTITVSGTIDLDTAYTDGLYLGLGGGVMTGDITFSGTQVFPGVLPLAGGAMTGDITFSGTQTFPPQDLNTVTTAGNTTANSIDVGGLTANGLTYPVADGVAGDVLVTDGAGSLSFTTPPTVDLQWVTDNGAVTTNSIDVAGLTAAGLVYPAADGAAKEVMTTDGAGNLGWLATAEVVAVPTGSLDSGSFGQIAFGGGNFYFHDGSQWWQVAGVAF